MNCPDTSTSSTDAAASGSMLRPASSKLAAGALLLAAGLSGCVTAPPRVYHRGVAAESRVPPATQVIFYPNAGQSAAQQDRDRYECYRWAVQQSRFDPNSPQAAPQQRVDVVPAAPPGVNTAAGAVTGAILGAAVSRPRAAGGGAIIGAVAGALVGASADANNEAQAERIQQRYDQRDARQNARLDRQAEDFRRAMSACLGARNYTVR